MRKEEILKQWGLIFQSSMIFYLGVIIVGLIPMVTLEDSLWERNWVFVVLGLILGAIIFIGLIVMLITMLLSIWPAVRKFDYLYIVILVLTLAMLDLESSLPEMTQIIVFSSVTGLVIILQLKARRMIQQSNEEELRSSWKQGISNLPEVDQTKKINVTKIMMSILVVIVFVALNDFEQLSDQVVTYLLVLAIGVYVIRLYHDTYNIIQKQKVMNIVFFGISYLGILVILYFLGSFFMHHIILKSLLVLLPFIPYLWVVAPHFYIITWLEKENYLTK